METADLLGYKDAIEQMDLLKNDLRQSPHYWSNYGRLFYKSQNYLAAVEKFKRESELTSNPELYKKIGTCYERMSEYSNAAQAYKVAENIEPHLFAPRYESLRLFEMAKDTLNAVLKAKEIIDMNPKVPSEKVSFYKREAQTTLIFLTYKN